MYEKEKRGKSASYLEHFRRFLSQAEENEQKAFDGSTIKLTSRDEKIIMWLYSNTGYYLECIPCGNLRGAFGNVDGMTCFRVEQPIDLTDQLLYCRTMQQSFAPTLSYLAWRRTKVQLNGYAYGRFFYVTVLQEVDRGDNPPSTSLSFSAH